MQTLWQIIPRKNLSKISRRENSLKFSVWQMYQNFQKSLRNTRKNFMAVSNFDVTLVTENSTIKPQQYMYPPLNRIIQMWTKAMWKMLQTIYWFNSSREESFKCHICTESFAFKIYLQNLILISHGCLVSEYYELLYKMDNWSYLMSVKIVTRSLSKALLGYNIFQVEDCEHFHQI